MLYYLAAKQARSAQASLLKVKARPLDSTYRICQKGAIEVFVLECVC